MMVSRESGRKHADATPVTGIVARWATREDEGRPDDSPGRARNNPQPSPAHKPTENTLTHLPTDAMPVETEYCPSRLLLVAPPLLTLTVQACWPQTTSSRFPRPVSPSYTASALQAAPAADNALAYAATDIELKKSYRKLAIRVRDLPFSPLLARARPIPFDERTNARS